MPEGFVGTAEPREEAVRLIYTGPEVEELKLESDKTQKGLLTLWDAQGKLQRKGSYAGKTATLQVDDLPAGVYWLRLETQEDFPLVWKILLW